MYADFIAGWTAGGVGLLVGHPLDTVKARLQTMNVYRGITDCMIQTMKHESVHGLFKGMFVPFISTGALNSLLFTGYGASLKYLHPEDSNIMNRKDLPMTDILIASICGTLVQVGPMIPVELLKTKLQVQRETVSHFSKHSQHLYSGPLECARETVRAEGVRGLFKGGSVVFVRDNIGYLFYIPVYEGLSRYFRRHDLENAWTQLCAGGCAGVCGWISVCPLEVVKNRIQADNSHRATLMWLLLNLCFIIGINGLDNGLARTPPMGWMSWTAFYCEIDCVKHPTGCINEQLYKDMADQLVAGGYDKLGYKSVHIDDCWPEMQRDSNGVLVANKTRFPSGMKTLAKYMHDRGLKFGIYEDYGTKTCGGYPGSYRHEKIDAQTFAAWDVDYLKLDGCNIAEELMPIGYPHFEKELNATGRPIVYSCSWPAYLIDKPELVNYKLIGKYCNTWRNYDDINSSWKSIVSIISYYDANQNKHIPTHGPGKWHDPDMLVIGNKGITLDMAISQFTVWCIWSAPLIMSNDLRIIGEPFKQVLQNQEAIRINQDPLGIMGRLIQNKTDLGTYVKQITPSKGNRKSFAFAILNRNENVKYEHVEILLSSLGLNDPDGYYVHDVWGQRDLGLIRPKDTIVVNIAAAGSVFFRADLASLHQPLGDRRYRFDNSNVIYAFEKLQNTMERLDLLDYLRTNRVQF